VLAAPTHRANQLKSLLKQYLSTKDATLHALALCVLVQKSHGLFQKHWQPLLNHMQEFSCSIPGFAFYYDNGVTKAPVSPHIAAMTAKLNTVNSSESPTLMFEGLACGNLPPYSWIVVQHNVL
jgi:hypothetical protein